MRRPKHTLNSQKLRFLSLEPILAPDMRVVSVDPGVNKKKLQQEECFNYAEEMGGKKNVAFQRPFQCKVGQERCYLLSVNIWIVLYDVHRENKTQYLCSLFFPDSH